MKNAITYRNLQVVAWPCRWCSLSLK